MRKSLTKFDWLFECWAVQKRVNLVDLVKSFQTSIYYLFARFGFDTAENEPLKVCQKLAKVRNNSKKHNGEPRGRDPDRDLRFVAQQHRLQAEGREQEDAEEDPGVGRGAREA